MYRIALHYCIVLYCIDDDRGVILEHFSSSFGRPKRNETKSKRNRNEIETKSKQNKTKQNKTYYVRHSRVLTAFAELVDCSGGTYYFMNESMNVWMGGIID